MSPKGFDACGVAGLGEAGDGRDDRGLRELGMCLAGAVTLLGAYGGGVYLRAPDAGSLVLAVAVGLPPQFSGPWRRIGPDAQEGPADAVRRRELVWLDGMQEMARWYPRTALALPYRFASACLPLVEDQAAEGGGEVHGALFVNWAASHPKRPDPAERAQLEAAAAAMARIVARTAATGRPIRPPQQLLVLPGPGSCMGDSAECSAVARLPEGLCALGVDGRITLVTPAAAALLGAAPSELLGALPWQVLPWLDHPAYEERYREAAFSQRPTAFVALRPPASWLSFHLYPDGSGMTVRITEAQSGPQQHPTPESQPHTPARLETVYHVLHLAGALAKATGVRDIMRLVTDELLPVFGGTRAVLLAVKPDGLLHVVGAHGYPPATLQHLDRMAVTRHDPAARALANGVPLFLEDRRQMARVYPQHIEFSQGSAWAILPLLAAEQPAGVCVLSYDRPRRFSIEERATLTALGGLIAQALMRARRYDTTYGLARDLQDALLPTALPTVPGLQVAARYLPASEGMDVGGDFYDLISLPHRQVAAVIGDVQGHNATAAAVMGQVRTAVRAHAATGADPRHVLARTNQLLTELDTELLASAAYLHLDLRRHRAFLVLAGHPHPLLCHTDGHVHPLHASPGLLLGIDPNITYPRTRVHLPSGAILALYTDGLTDLPGTDPDHALQTLTHRLSSAANAHWSLEEIADTLLQEATRTDDVTLLLLRTTGQPA